MKGRFSRRSSTLSQLFISHDIVSQGISVNITRRQGIDSNDIGDADECNLFLQNLPKT